MRHLLGLCPELEEYHVRGDSGVRGKEVHPFYIDRKNNQVYQKKGQGDNFELVGDTNSHPEDEEE